MAKATRLIRPRTVTGDGEGLVSHAGLVWLGEVADRSGLTVGFSQVLASAPRRRHDPGVTLVQLANPVCGFQVVRRSAKRSGARPCCWHG
jgi:hypothetical protein